MNDKYVPTLRFKLLGMLNIKLKVQELARKTCLKFEIRDPLRSKFQIQRCPGLEPIGLELVLEVRISDPHPGGRAPADPNKNVATRRCLSRQNQRGV